MRIFKEVKLTIKKLQLSKEISYDIAIYYTFGIKMEF